MTDERPEPFAWHAHPAAERQKASAAASALILAFAGAIYLSFQSLAWTGLGVLVLVVALNRWFFPSRFTIDAEGITARFPLRTQRVRWAEARRFVVDRHGGYLSRRARRSWLDAYQGLQVLFGRNRAAVIDRIRAHLPQGAAP